MAAWKWGPALAADYVRATGLSGTAEMIAQRSTNGDAAARALVLGAMAPFGVIASTIYAHDSESTLELVGAYGTDEEMSSAYRVVPLTMPMPLSEAFVTLSIT